MITEHINYFQISLITRLLIIYLQVPVYGQIGGPESYTQNDQPLEFGTVPEGGYSLPVEGGEPAPPTPVPMESAEMSHQPEIYKVVPTSKIICFTLLSVSC